MGKNKSVVGEVICDYDGGPYVDIRFSYSPKEGQVFVRVFTFPSGDLKKGDKVRITVSKVK